MESVLVAPAYDPRVRPRQDVDLEVLLAWLRRSGLAASVVDAQASRLDPEALAERLREGRPALIYWHLAGCGDYRALAAAAPQVGLPGTPLVAGGDFATRHDLAILAASPEIAAVVRGEPEQTLEALAGDLGAGRSWCSEPGLSLRVGDQWVRNRPRPLLEDLDALPMAASDLFEPGRNESGQHVLVNRGCNGNCSYCGLQVPYREEFPGRLRFWRSRSPHSIVDEIEFYHREKGTTTFLFNAFVLLGHDERGGAMIAEVAREILRRRLPIRFSFVSQPRPVVRNRELLPLLKSAGLFRITLGIDTGLERARALYDLEFSRGEALLALQALHEADVPFVPSFIFYDPYLTLAEIRDNLRFLIEIEPWFGHMPVPYGYFLDQHLLGSVLRVRPEMPIYRRLVNDGLAREVDPLSEETAVRFREPAVGKVFKLHQQANAAIARRARPLLFSAKVVGRFPGLRRFPLDLVEHMVTLVEGNPAVDEGAAMEDLLRWSRSELKPCLPEGLELLGVPDESRTSFDLLREP